MLKSKCVSGISDENLASESTYITDIMFTPDFEDSVQKSNLKLFH